MFLREKNGLRPRRLAYYACLGMGFMLVEIPIIQKFILPFGRPTLTFSVILFSLLLCTSLGSLVMQRFQAANLRKLVIVSAGRASSPDHDRAGPGGGVCTQDAIVVPMLPSGLPKNNHAHNHLIVLWLACNRMVDWDLMLFIDNL